MSAAVGEAVSRGRPFHHGRESVISYPVTADGVRTRVVEAGSGDNVIVCLHGAGSRADRWIPAMPGMVDRGFHVFAIDFPGHGFADKGPDLEYTAAAFSRLVAGVLDALGLSRVTVAGTSLGGHVAARLACDREDMVSNLVLIGSLGLTEFPEQFMTPPEVVANGSPEGVRRKLSFLVSDPAMVTDAWVREESMINTSAGAAEALLAVARFLNEGTNDDLQGERLVNLSLDREILLVWGADDKWTPPEMGHAARAALPKSQLVLMDGCGHAPYFEDPDQFVELLERYFSLQPLAGA
jgi:2-hydroxy-6-oxonona-2,4-dienedioate hydrolase